MMRLPSTKANRAVQKKKLTSNHLDEYAQRMQNIVTRTNAITQLKRFSANLPFIVLTEIIHLQLRHILELTATALLVVNKDVVNLKDYAGIREWHALELLDKIEDFNPEYYPVPTKDGRRNADGVIPIIQKKGDYLTREKFTTLYRACGEVLHTPNPYAKRNVIKLSTKQDCQKMIRAADRWQSRIVRLLTHHTFRIKGDDSLYVAHTVGEEHIFHVVKIAIDPGSKMA